MPGCCIERNVSGSAAVFRVSGRFEGACAWDLSARIGAEPLASLVLDFSRVSQFADHGIAVLAGALLGVPRKAVELRGLRHHQVRLLAYFGVDAAALARPEKAAALPAGSASAAAREVA